MNPLNHIFTLSNLTEAQSNQNFLVIIYMIIFLSVIAYCLKTLIVNRNIHRVISSTPMTPISDVKPGFRKVRGILRAVDRTLKSPVRNQECVFFRLKVTQVKHTGSGDNTGIQSKTLLNYSEYSDAYLEDGVNKLPIDISQIRWLDTKTLHKDLKKKDQQIERVLEQKFGLSLPLEKDVENDRCYYQVCETFFRRNRNCFAFGSVSEDEDIKITERSEGIKISTESEGSLMMTDGPHGSLLSTKGEEVYLEWLEDIISRSIKFMILSCIALVLPLGLWIAPNRVIGGQIFGGTFIICLIVFVYFSKGGKHYEGFGDL